MTRNESREDNFGAEGAAFEGSDMILQNSTLDGMNHLSLNCTVQ